MCQLGGSFWMKLAFKLANSEQSGWRRLIQSREELKGTKRSGSQASKTSMDCLQSLSAPLDLLGLESVGLKMHILDFP